MIKTAIKILLLIVLVACNLTQKLTSSNESQIQIIINEGKPIKEGESIHFEIRNNSLRDLTLINPYKILIDKKEGESWQKIRILDCPCDAPCQPKPEKKLLETGKSFLLNWDQNESWCGPRSSAQIRETIYKKVGSGSYRLLIRSKKNGKESTSYKYFNITIK